MALTRARPVAGAECLRTRAGEEIRTVLSRPRDPVRLLRDVADMRRRIDELHRTTNPLDVKYVRGGIVDAEFVAQYLQLSAAAEFPSVLNADTATAFDALGRHGVITADLAGRLMRATFLLRNVQGVLRAALDAETAAETPPEPLMDAVARAAGVVSHRQVHTELVQTQAWVYQRFQELVECPAATLPQETD